MEIPKDVFEYMTNFADDATIVAMLSTNKKYNNPLFFEKIMKRKYPLLLKLKRENETVKTFYLGMVHYISKLKEEFSISFDGTYNPEKFYNFLILLSPVLHNLKSLDYIRKNDDEDYDENSINITLQTNDENTPRLIQIYVDENNVTFIHKIKETSQETIEKIDLNRFPQIKDIKNLLIGENPKIIELLKGPEIIISTRLDWDYYNYNL